MTDVARKLRGDVLLGDVLALPEEYRAHIAEILGPGTRVGLLCGCG